MKQLLARRWSGTHHLPLAFVTLAFSDGFAFQSPCVAADASSPNNPERQAAPLNPFEQAAATPAAAKPAATLSPLEQAARGVGLNPFEQAARGGMGNTRENPFEREASLARERSAGQQVARQETQRLGLAQREQERLAAARREQSRQQEVVTQKQGQRSLAELSPSEPPPVAFVPRTSSYNDDFQIRQEEFRRTTEENMRRQREETARSMESQRHRDEQLNDSINRTRERWNREAEQRRQQQREEQRERDMQRQHDMLRRTGHTW
jgi:hypothetical protein